MKKSDQILVVVILLFVGLFGSLDNSYALVNTATSSAKLLQLSQKEVIQKEKAGQEIDRRITSLNKLISRIEEMRKLNDVDKTELSLQTQDQITSLASLKIKINEDNDQASLKADRQAIYNQYRIYLMFMPKIQILATADRITEISSDSARMIPKLSDRISKDKLAGKDVTSLESVLTDLQNKLVDANTQAKAAWDLVIPLVPDEGDLVIGKANLETLKNAREKLVLAKKDLAGIVADINLIRVGLSKIEKEKIATSSAIKLEKHNTATSSAGN